MIKWSRNKGDIFSQICGICEETKNTEEDLGISEKNLDTSVKPYENFFKYSNGGWMANNTIPAGYPTWNSFLHLHNLSQERLKDVLENLNSIPVEERSEDETKLATFFKAAMDEESIESDGLKSMKSVFDDIDECVWAAGEEDISSKLGLLNAKYGLSPFFSIYASPDYKKSDWTICHLSQGGLGLPDRDYYFDNDKAEKRILYKEHIARMLNFLEMDLGDSAENVANIVYDIELKLAESHMTKTECRDPHATYNVTQMNDLVKNYGDIFDFTSFLAASTAKEMTYVNVRNVKAIECCAKLISNIDAHKLKVYLLWNAVHSFAKYLPKKFVEEDFEFYEKILSGTSEIKPRWKRAMQYTESALGEALGQIYCKKFFDDSCKEKALSIVEKVRQALEDRLHEVEWMTSDETRKQALQKMNGFKVKIGYPDKWIDYSSLNVVKGQSFLQMIIASRAFNHSRQIKEMAAPTDKDKWFLTPQTINAYYHPSLNEIVFPAAILQPPMFNPDADDAINFGTMGAVIGHEMTHGFDDKGRKFNSDGNMVGWWTKEDAEEYERRVGVVVKQANEFKVYGQSVKGELTCGENIADLGGLKLSLRAFKAEKSFNASPISGFTPLQRFFLSWAQCWRNLITKERALQLITLDPHGPNEMRCNGPLSNMQEFHTAFNIPKGKNMYKPNGERVDIW